MCVDVGDCEFDSLCVPVGDSLSVGMIVYICGWLYCVCGVL